MMRKYSNLLSTTVYLAKKNATYIYFFLILSALDAILHLRQQAKQRRHLISDALVRKCAKEIPTEGEDFCRDKMIKFDF